MTTEQQAWYLPAYAKINLGLRVLSRRPDGYHEIDTWMHAIGLGDDLWCRAHSEPESSDAPDVRLRVASEDGLAGLPVGDDDDILVVRAGRSFLTHAGLVGRVGLEFSLLKRIPAGGGLGGGSADAAAALRLANVACGEVCSMQDLHGLAVGLGADVPFFLAGGTQRARGIGDRLERLRGSDAPQLHIVLLLPREGTSTADVYRAFELPERLPGEAVGLGETPTGSREVPVRFGNDLEATALGLYPALARVRERARELGADNVELSGSGSTFFVLCPTAHATRLTRQALAPLTAEFGARVMATASAPLFGPPRRTGWQELPEVDRGDAMAQPALATARRAEEGGEQVS